MPDVFLFSTSSIGSSHLEKGLPNQDRYFCCQLAPNVVAGGVFDGVSSAKDGGAGAQRACSTIQELLTFAFVPNPDYYAALVKTALCCAYGALKNNDGDPDFAQATTAAIAIYDMEHETLAFAQSGDSSMVYIVNGGEGEETDESVIRCLQPQKGKSDHETYTVQNGSFTWTWGEIRDVSGFLLATDGVFEALCEKAEAGGFEPGIYARALVAEIISDPETAGELIASNIANKIGFCSYITDDITLVTAMSLPKPQQGREHEQVPQREPQHQLCAQEGDTYRVPQRERAPRREPVQSALPRREAHSLINRLRGRKPASMEYSVEDGQW